MASDREGEREASHEEAWRLFLQAERKELELRREGQLAKLLGDPLPGESEEELERLTEKDRIGAMGGFVELMNESGRVTHRHIDDLTPEDRMARIRAEGARIEWLVERQRRRGPSSRPPRSGG